ncbi:hypothetical protein Tco_1015219 [Tanacetum coccineum]|uniref:Uncharacterized protein n=1 Tax=Tanacetum coccineum TaxID=301880 RepID=A0ABQ5FL92_9ASTR
MQSISDICEPAECKASTTYVNPLSAKHQQLIKDSLSAKPQRATTGIHVRDIVKEVNDYLKTYSSAGMDNPIVSGTVPPILPPLVSDTSNPSNRVDDFTTDNINATTTSNVAQKDFSNWKDRFLVYLYGLEPYLLEILQNRPFVPMSTLSTTSNPLPKPQKQWSQADRRLVNQDKRLKTALYGKYNYEEGLIDQIYESETNRFTIQAHRIKALISNLQMQDSDSDVEEDKRSSSEFLADLNTEVKYKGLKAEIVVLTKKIDAMTKGKSEKGLVDESFDWDEESVSSDDDDVIKVKALMAITKDELSFGRADARSGQWVEITMKKVQNLLSMIDSDERKHVLDYTHVDLHYVEDQRKKLAWQVSTIKGKAGSKPPSVSESYLDKNSDLTTEKLLLTLMEEVKGLKEHIKLPTYTSPSESQSSSSKSAVGKQRLWFGPCKHCGFKNNLSKDYYMKPTCSTCGSYEHLTKEHPELIAVQRTLTKLKAQSSQGSARKVQKIPKPYIPCKYYGFNDHHSDECEYYPGCDHYASIAHETSDCDYLKWYVWYLDSGCSKFMTGVKQSMHIYLKELGPKVVFGDNSSGDTKGYGSVNCNGITFT